MALPLGEPQRLERITVDLREQPIGVGPAPRFGWIRPAGTPEQTAWRVRVAEADLTVWDSGVVPGEGTVDVPYAGPPMHDLRRHEISVWSWSASGVAVGSSRFVSGLAAESALWDAAAWIGGPGTAPAPLLRREFDVGERPASAFLVVAAGGHARAELNGAAVEPAILSPGFTDYDARVQYTVSEVTALLRPGANAIGVELGRGFYGVTAPDEWDWHVATWRAEPCVRLLLVTDVDGERRVLGTDDSWLAVEGPTRLDDVFAGEDYDDRRAIPGWSEPGSDAAGWRPAQPVAGPRGRLEVQRQPPIIVAEEFAPTRVDDIDGGWVFAFPRVIAGWVRVELDGPAGEEVEIRLAERLGPDGLPDVADPYGYYAGRFQTHRVTLAGRSLTWEPRFGYQGFQYAVVFASRRPRVVARLVHSAVARTGSFRSSSPTLDALHELSVRTVLNNLHGLPTDTPTFEKNGWTGDGMLGAEFMLMNLDIHALLVKWVQDVADSRRGGSAPSVIAPDGGWRVDWTPAPPWHSALVLVPWWIHRYRGDLRVLRDLWPAISEYVAFEFARSAGGIASTTLGDWVTPETSPAGGNAPEDARVPATAFLFAMLRATASIAGDLGEDPRPWLRRAADVRRAFLRAFLDRARGMIRGEGDDGHRQTHHVLALAFGLVPRSLEQRIADVLAADIRSRGDHLNTGALGTKWLLPVLTRHGHADLALAVAEQRTFPSWGFWLEHGATTLWEHWDPASRSRNHYFLGTFDDWLFHDVAGLRPTAPGWRRFEVAPRLTRLLDRAEAAVVTPLGRAAVSWRRVDDGVAVTVDVPSGARADLSLEEHRQELGPGRHERVVRRGGGPS